MSLPSPNLDDRTFDQLVAEAKRRVRQTCPQWSDLSPSDPGWALLELFAYLTEIMLYRLNQVPTKAYIEFLKLIGVTLHPPSAASVELKFYLTQPREHPVMIERGTRVTVARARAAANAPVFITDHSVTIPAGQTDARVTAHHCEQIEAELVGYGTGQPGLSLQAQQPPLIAPTGDPLDLLVGIETDPDELDTHYRSVTHQGRCFQIWQEVETFANQAPTTCIYTVDRYNGRITFAPCVPSSADKDPFSPKVPLENREVRLWYRCGGGPAGNVAADTLTVLKDSLPGVHVTNPEAATGGRVAETLDQALIRGPLEFRSLERAVTASDYELLALKSSGAVSRARAFTQKQYWTYAQPGTVEVLLIPTLPDNLTAAVQTSAEQYQAAATEESRNQVQQALHLRRPLGTTCLVHWARLKTVTVKALIVVHRGEDRQAVQSRVLHRLYQAINPTVWEFGQPLREDRIYNIIGQEPGVRYTEQVRFRVNEAPDQHVKLLTMDPNQPRTCYAASGHTLFRSMNNGDSWELVKRFPEQVIKVIEAHPAIPGLVAIATCQPQTSQLHFSQDCGETWVAGPQMAFQVEDLAWVLHSDRRPILLLATTVGLYALPTLAGADLVQVLVDPTDQDRGFYAVVTSEDARGLINVAVAAQGMGGVYLSSEAGYSGTFSPIGLLGEDIRVLEIQKQGPRQFLWAGSYVAGNEMGRGCFRWELPHSVEGWQSFQSGWSGGSCRSLTFRESNVIAGTYFSGILTLDSSRSEANWQTSTMRCGLPIRDQEHNFYPIEAVGYTASPESVGLVAGPEGIYRSLDEGSSYHYCSGQEFNDKVMLPESWLFCSGQHEIEVKSE